MTRRTRLLLATAASVAIAGGAASKAMAFEIVDWEWLKLVDVTETITITVTDTFDLSGLVELEKWQLNFGDVTATATVTNVSNNPPGGGGLSGDFDETFIFEAGELGALTYDDAQDPDAIDPAGPFVLNGVNLEIIGGTVDEGADLLTPTIRVFGELGEDGVDIDAVDLPQVLNEATAVANNQSIESTTAMQLHDLQIAAGGINAIGDCDTGCTEPDPIAFLIAAYGLTLVDDQLEGINEQYDMAFLTILGAATGFIEPTTITATATVDDILNASVDNTATAVGNNASFKIAAATPGDGYFIGDVTQLLIGDVTATASATNIEVIGYTNFGGADFGNLSDPQTPLVSNVATAVGNNLNIKVDNCTLCQPVEVPNP